MIKNRPNLKIGVIGGGSWGTALANLLALNSYKPSLWVFEKDIKESIEKNQENQIFLPNIKLSSNIKPSNDLKKTVADKDLLLIVVPTNFFRTIIIELKDYIKKDAIIISASKGIENETFLTMTQILFELIPKIPKENIAALSGPSFAKEVALSIPTAVSIASLSEKNAKILQEVFSSPFFRVYTNDDLIGVELGGAVKNVIAIASGIVDGLDLGLNTRAALITRGLSEIKRLGLALGAKQETFAGLSGIGDLVLTCTGTLSRNHTVGFKIGKGKKLKDILAEMKMVAEGVKTTKSVYFLSKKLQTEMPITNCVYKILYEDYPPTKAIKELMIRSLKSENE